MMHLERSGESGIFGNFELSLIYQAIQNPPAPTKICHNFEADSIQRLPGFICPICMRPKYDVDEIMADPILEISSHENRNF